MQRPLAARSGITIDGINSDLIGGLGEAFHSAVAGSAKAAFDSAARLSLLHGVRLRLLADRIAVTPQQSP